LIFSVAVLHNFLHTATERVSRK